MDPNACLDMMLSAVAREDVAEFLEHDRNLTDWGRKGGFAPALIEGMAADLEAYLADLAAGGISPRAHVDVRVFIRDDGSLDMATGDASFDTDHRGYCGASSIRVSAGARCPEAARARCRAVVFECFDDACEHFATACS
jgi:hypothetical protein